MPRALVFLLVAVAALTIVPDQDPEQGFYCRSGDFPLGKAGIPRDWSSCVQMAELGFWLGWEAANAATMPNWRKGDEFRAARDRSPAAIR